ncbi:MAG: hypothetical protein BGO01_03625 [Armatimonadetes bacterium 55-13]|nr:MAG: hypothetical protein BGO01_03625 [Armatimonadetes bacterium 55-13]
MATSIAAVLRDIKIYQQLTGASYRITWSAIDIYVNGAFNITLPGSGIDASSAGVGQNYIPIIGVPLDITGGCSAGRAGIDPFEWNPCDPADFAPQSYTTQASGTAEGGWRFKEVGGDWQTLPCTPYYVDSPSTGGTCPFGLSAAGIVEATDTYDVDINVESYTEHEFTYEGRDTCQYLVEVCCTEVDDGGDGEPNCVIYDASGAHCIDPCLGFPNFVEPFRDVYKSRTRTRGASGRMRIVPDMERAIKRHRENYRALWLRLPLPQVTASASRTCTIDSVTTSGSSNPQVYPGSAEFLGAVGDDTHAMEDFFALPTYSPTNAGKSESETINYTSYGPGICECGDFNNVGPGMCPDGYGIACGEVCPEYDNSSESESVGYSFVATVGDEGSYQWHLDDELRYLGTWCNLHWHYLHWHQDWSDIGYLDYWGPGRQQWIFNEALPPDEKRRTRSDMIGSCHEESGHTPFLDAFVGGYRWLGCSRWKVRKPTVPTEKPTDATGAARWTFGDFVEGEWTGSGTVGASVTLDVGTTRATVDVLDFMSTPYLYALICDRIRIDNAFTNAASFTVTAIGVDGSEATLCTSAGTWDIPKGRSKRYAGSWGIDNGLGVLDDLGVDTITGKGISPDTMSDPERLVGFELLPSYGIAKLRYDIVPVDDEDPIVIPHPVFLKAPTTPVMVWESGQIVALLFEDGGMIRLGNWVWYIPGMGLLNPPAISGAGYKSTVIDALCTLRVIWEARAHDDDLTTECTELYDFYEGQSIGVVDKFSVSYPLTTEQGLPFALVNTMSEGPPLCCFPNKSWNSTTWVQNGDYKLEVWDWAQEPRYLITAGDEPAHLFDPDEVQWTTVFEDVPNGWSASVHTHEVDNLESVNFRVRKGGKKWAHVAPWRGFSCVLDLGEGRKIPSVDCHPDGTWYRAYLADGKAKTGYRFRTGDWNDTLQDDIEADSVCIRVDPTSKGNRIWLMVGKDTTITLRYSDDRGVTWSAVQLTMAGKFPYFIYTDDRKRFDFWQDGTTIKAQFKDAQNNNVGAEITVTTDVDEDSGVVADYSVGDKGKRVFGALVMKDEVITWLTSEDGFTWT